MKKLLSILLVVALVGLALPAQAMQGSGRGGVMGLIAGCCLGPRAAGDYNDGKEIHWREWVGLISYVGIVFAIWNGVDGANGVTTSEYAEQYGSMFY